MIAQAQLQTGSRLEAFEIIERIGSGAFSDVYRARDRAGRDVVLKCPHEVILGDTATFDRFRREIEDLVREAKKGAEEFIQQIKKEIAELENEGGEP